MPNIANLLSWLFAAISLSVVAFFTHKVVWLVRYKKLQRKLMDEAAGELRSAQERTLPEWRKFAAAAWRVARGPQHQGELDSPAAYCSAVEQELQHAVSRLQNRQRIAPLLRHAVERTEAGPIEERILESPLRDEKVATATIRLRAPVVCQPTPPPESAYELNIRSRYSFWRRALVFVTGLADVVYSSNHIAKMSQYTHVSWGTILRRMSLVILLVVGILLEVVFGLRVALERVIQRRVINGSSWVRDLPDLVRDNAASLLALAMWTGTIATLYFMLYFRIRRRSKQHLKSLQSLKLDESKRLANIRRQHMVGLTEWATAYGKSLDNAAELTARHIEMLSHHYAARVRRELGGDKLIDVATMVSRTLFELLPEASSTLQTAVTTQERSLGHAFWPRREEMGDVIEQAQHREAWQGLELNLGEIQRGEPNPEHVAALWETLVLYAVRFSAVMPNDVMTQLRGAYMSLVDKTSRATEADLGRFQASVGDLIRHLDEQLGSATPLLSARIELANQRIRADSANFNAEIIRAREAARLEAMAFEI